MESVAELIEKGQQRIQEHDKDECDTENKADTKGTKVFPSLFKIGEMEEMR